MILKKCLKYGNLYKRFVTSGMCFVYVEILPIFSTHECTCMLFLHVQMIACLRACRFTMQYDFFLFLDFYLGTFNIGIVRPCKSLLAFCQLVAYIGIRWYQYI